MLHRDGKVYRAGFKRYPNGDRFFFPVRKTCKAYAGMKVNSSMERGRAEASWYIRRAINMRESG